MIEDRVVLLTLDKSPQGGVSGRTVLCELLIDLTSWLVTMMPTRFGALSAPTTQMCWASRAKLPNVLGDSRGWNL